MTKTEIEQIEKLNQVNHQFFKENERLDYDNGALRETNQALKEENERLRNELVKLKLKNKESGRLVNVFVKE